MPSSPEPWGLHWRSKPSFIFTTVAAGLFTDLFYYGIVVPVLPFILEDHFNIPEDQVQPYTSGLLSTYAWASVFFSIPAGWAAGRLGPRRLFLAGSVFLFVAIALFSFAKSLNLVVASRLLQGAATAVIWTSGLAIVQDTVAPGEIGEVIGTIFSAISVGELVAPVLGGILYDKAGIIAIVAVAALVFVVDIILWILIIDQKTAIEYRDTLVSNQAETGENPQVEAVGPEPEAREDDPLLPRGDNDRYIIHGEPNNLVKVFPILYCFREPRLHMAMILSFVQSLLMGCLDATVPTEAESLFKFSSSQTGLLFIALMLPYLALGRAAGAAVDKYGPRTVAIGGYAFLAPCLTLLGLPERDFIPDNFKVIVFCVILSLNGIGIALISSPGYVEAVNVTSKYEAANPEFFGENGPFAELFGFNSLYVFSGLAAGHLLGGMLRARLGYGIMAAIFAGISAATAILSFLLMGEK